MHRLAPKTGILARELGQLIHIPRIAAKPFPKNIHDGLKAAEQFPETPTCLPRRGQDPSHRWQSPCIPSSVAQTCSGAYFRQFRIWAAVTRQRAHRSQPRQQWVLDGGTQDAIFRFPFPILFPCWAALIQAFYLWHRSTMTI